MADEEETIVTGMDYKTPAGLVREQKVYEKEWFRIYGEPAKGRTHYLAADPASSADFIVVDYSDLEKRIMGKYPLKEYAAIYIDSITKFNDVWTSTYMTFKRRPRNKGQRKYRARKGWRRYS